MERILNSKAIETGGGALVVREGSCITWTHLLGDINLGKVKVEVVIVGMACANCERQLHLKL